MKARLKGIRGDLFWDIGANIGFYSLLMKGNFSRIIAVEPNAETAATLRKRTRGAGNIEVLELALSNASGPVSFYSQKGNFSIPGFNNKNGSDSLLSRVEYKSARDPSNDRVVENRPSCQVLQRSFDELNAGSVDLVKIDVEGAEFLVLEGMRNNLQNRSVKRIMVELHNKENQSRLESTFTEYGYAVEWIDSDHLFATVR